MEGDLIMAWAEFKKSGVTEKTPENILLGAGTFYKDFTFSSDKSEWSGTVISATKNGGKYNYVPELYDISVDGVWVKTKGLTEKTGETSTIETTLLEVTKENIKMTSFGQEGDSEDARFEVIESKEHINEDDYIKDFAFVGFKKNGDPIIIKYDYAICTSGFGIETKNKEESAFPVVFECCADLNSGNTQKLPWHIYYPVASV